MNWSRFNVVTSHESPDPISSFVILYGQDHANSCPAPKLALGFHPSTVQLRDMFHNCQPQACPSQFATASLVGAIKALEDSRQVIFADSKSVIGYAEHYFIPALRRLQVDLSVFMRIFHRIFHEVIEH